MYLKPDIDDDVKSAAATVWPATAGFTPSASTATTGNSSMMPTEKYVVAIGFALMAIAAGHASITTGAVSPLVVVALVGLAFVLGALSQSPDALEE